MPKPLQYTIILISLALFSSCDAGLSKTSDWKSDAQEKLLALQAAVEELQQFDSILQKEMSKNHGLTIKSNETDKLQEKYKISLPKTKIWFETANQYNVGVNYIQFKHENIKASFGKYSSDAENFWAFLYYSKTEVVPGFPRTQEFSSEIIDVLSLGNNWNFVLLWCEECTAD
jgi:hypothetical protein